MGLCVDCPAEFREVPGMVGFVTPTSGKFWEAPVHFCSSWANVLLRKRCCVERRDATVRWRGNVGGAGLILRVLWRS